MNNASSIQEKLPEIPRIIEQTTSDIEKLNSRLADLAERLAMVTRPVNLESASPDQDEPATPIGTKLAINRRGIGIAIEKIDSIINGLAI